MVPKKYSKKRSKGPSADGSVDQQQVQRPVAVTASAKHDQELPNKFQSLFKLVVKCYEMKQWKKGIKTADLILKKYPQHGETMAMKGLLLNCIDKRDDGLNLVKTGLRHNLKSHICWHVFGLFYRSARDYDEAIKCYLNALRIDPGNVQILRDLSLLQMQQRDLKGFQEIRRRIVVLQPANRLHWLAFSVASHLNGDHNKAVEILTSYEGTRNKERDVDYELSEMLLYKNSILEESGDVEKTLQHMDEIEGDVFDTLSLKERRGFLLIARGDLESAKAIFTTLLETNSENIAYHRGLRLSHGFSESLRELSDADTQAMLALYKELQAKHPRSFTCQLLPLYFTTGDMFISLVSPLLVNRLGKGVMSLFEILRGVYCLKDVKGLAKGTDDDCNDSAFADMEKVDVVTSMLTSFAAELRRHGRFLPSDDLQAAPKDSLMWTLYCLAQHHDYFGRYEGALDTIEEALALSPEEIDLIVLKAGILQHAGDLKGAYDLMECARLKDTGDRFLNTKTVKFALRAGLFDEAERTVALFLRDGDSLISLFDMQCMWYELACGEAYLSAKKFGRALKNFTSVVKHFDDIHEDQFDFHTYCLRKMTLRSYVRTLKFEDSLRGHRFFVAAATGIIQTYIALEMHRAEAVEAKSKDDRTCGNADEEKRLAAKAKRAAAKAKLKAIHATGASENTPGKEVDQDPVGEQLAATTDPLGEATKMMHLLSTYAPNDINTHLLAVRIYTLKEKPLLVLRSLHRAWKLDRTHDAVQLELVLFFTRMQQSRDRHHDIVNKMLELEHEELIGEAGVRDFAESVLAEKKALQQSLRARLTVARLQLHLAQDKAAAKVEAAELLASSFDCSDLTIAVCVEVQQFLRSSVSEASAASYSALARQHFPRSPYFHDAA